MKTIYTLQDARREKHYAQCISQPKPTRKFYVVAANGWPVINPVSERKAHAYVIEMDRDCPSSAPHRVVQVFA